MCFLHHYFHHICCIVFVDLYQLLHAKILKIHVFSSVFSVRASSEKLCKLVDFTMHLATIPLPFYHDFQHFFGIYLQMCFSIAFSRF